MLCYISCCLARIYVLFYYSIVYIMLYFRADSGGSCAQQRSAHSTQQGLTYSTYLYIHVTYIYIYIYTHIKHVIVICVYVCTYIYIYIHTYLLRSKLRANKDPPSTDPPLGNNGVRWSPLGVRARPSLAQYVHMYVCIHIYIYIYIYTHTSYV